MDVAQPYPTRSVAWQRHERSRFEHPLATHPKASAFCLVTTKRKTLDKQTWDKHRHLTWDEARWWLRNEEIPWPLMAVDIGLKEGRAFLGRF